MCGVWVWLCSERQCGVQICNPVIRDGTLIRIFDFEPGEKHANPLTIGLGRRPLTKGPADAAGRQVAANTADGSSNYTGQMKGTADAVAEEAERCMTLWGSAGQADVVLSHAAPWRPVEHLIVYNTSISDEEKVRAMIAEGERVLSRIPGVMRIFTGQAIQEKAGYKYTWLVKFCHPAVIDSYREHPDHVAFADTHFRPVAGDRISIDYQADWD